VWRSREEVFRNKFFWDKKDFIQTEEYNKKLQDEEGL
jgi:hypothetical protein